MKQRQRKKNQLLITMGTIKLIIKPEQVVKKVYTAKENQPKERDA